MKKLMDNDNFLKFFSLIISIICWVFILFITNPEIEVTVSDVPITLSDHQTIKGQGYIVSNTLDSTIDIKIKGTRQTLTNINKSNIMAYVDLAGYGKIGTYEIPVNIKLPYEDVTVTEKSLDTIPISIDKYGYRTFTLTYEFDGSLKNSDYSVHSTKLYDTLIRVYGPNELIKSIEKAVAVIPLSRASADFTGMAPVVFYNSNNTEVNQNNLDPDFTEVEFFCTVYETKEVEIIPADENKSSDIKITVTDYPKVTITGPAKEVDKITSLNTKKFTYVQEDLPLDLSVGLVIPENIKIKENITSVKVLVEEK